MRYSGIFGRTCGTMAYELTPLLQELTLLPMAVSAWDRVATLGILSTNSELGAKRALFFEKRSAISHNASDARRKMGDVYALH